MTGHLAVTEHLSVVGLEVAYCVLVVAFALPVVSLLTVEPLRMLVLVVGHPLVAGHSLVTELVVAFGTLSATDHPLVTGLVVELAPLVAGQLAGQTLVPGQPFVVELVAGFVHWLVAELVVNLGHPLVARLVVKHDSLVTGLGVEFGYPLEAGQPAEHPSVAGLVGKRVYLVAG